MPGAYSSKPPAAIVVPEYPDIPLNWKIDWPWPGPNPPGYATPDAGISLTSGTSVEVGGSVSASSLWMDEALAGPVGLPDGDWTQELSATINGSTIGLAKSDDLEFGNSIEYDYSIVGNYYGSSDNITFDISEENEGDTIILSVVSVVDGVEYEDSVEITVEAAENTNYATVSFSRIVGFSVTGSMSFSCSGGSVTFDSVTNSVTVATGAFVKTGTRTVTVNAESLTEIDGQTASGTWSATNGGGFSEDDDFVKCTVTSQLYNEADITIIGQSSSTTFKFPLGPYESGSETKTCMTFYEDSIIDLN